MTPVAALIADLVRAGVDADLIGRTAAALAEREPVFVPVGTGEADDVMVAEGHGGRSAAARRQARYRARRAAKPEADRNAGITRDVTRDGGQEAGENGRAPEIAGETADRTAVGDASDRNAALRCVTGDVTRYGEPQKDTSPQTPYQKNSPLKEKAPKGAQKKAPPIGAEAGLFAAEPDAGLNTGPGAGLRADLGGEPERAGATGDTVSTGKRRSRRHGGDITGLTAEFDDAVWPIYPQKVARKTALKAWASARQRADFDTIIAGLKRYVAKTDDRPWCNLSTWLNQDRWTDRPAPEPVSTPAASSARSPPWPVTRADHLREHHRRAQASFDKRTGQNNGKRDADIIDIDRTDWTVESRT
ncbi:hypothetical protein [Martelella endophytica]|uniref:hypothetical protein n=1 Tax=Martelella endophytica TaxID=1486262 RepID=UPI000695C808|nr:hypothetical protein [Martelella endophytica]